jgi:predicted AAA+ superfamily ATPase
MYPLSFFEYLEAKGRTKILEELKSIRLGDEMTAHEFVCEMYQEYVRVGGMPEVVENFTKNGNYSEVKEILSRIRTAYSDDIMKYAKTMSEKKYIELIIEYAPKMAGSLFTYENFGGSGYRSREMSEAIGIVEKVRLLHQVKAINSTNLPLMYKTNRAKKMIWLDVGMVHEANNLSQELMVGIYKGKIMEQVVGQTLIGLGIRRPVELSYWARNRDEGSAEVDFCIQHGDRVVGLEVKSGNMNGMKSLFSMMESGQGTVIPMRVSWDMLGTEKYSHNGKKYDIVSLPFYMVERWEDCIGSLTKV